MALAVLIASEEAPERYEFTADIGTNEFYEYRIGARSEDGGGLATIDHVSPLRRRDGPPDLFDSRFTFRIPPGLLSRASRDVQLCSYRDAQRNGPAVSRVVGVVPGLERLARGDRRGGLVMTATMQLESPSPCRRAAFSFQESGLSQAMFLDELLRALRILAPAVVDAAPAIVGGITGGKGIDGDVLSRLLKAVGDAMKSAPAGAPAPAAPAANGSSRGQSFGGVSRAAFVDGGVVTGPVLASLLGPLLEKAPQLLQVLTDKPLQFLTTLIQARRQGQIQREQNQQNFVAGLLAEANKNMLLQELVRRMGEGGQPAAAALPPAAATAESVRPAGRPLGGAGRSIAAPSVHLAFDGGATVDVCGKPRSVYRAAAGLTLLARVAVKGAAPRAPLPRAIVDVTMTELEGQRQVLAKSFRVTDVAAGAPLTLAFTADELRDVPRHRDLHVVATMRWPRSAGRGTATARGDHAVYLVDRHVLRSVGGDAGPEIALKDPDRHRAFWNRIWEGPGALGSASRWELDVVCRYYVRASFDHDSNARIETRLALDPAPDASALTFRMEGRMKSGMELSLDELNALAPQVGADPLPAEELAALGSSALRSRLDLEATTRVRLAGKKTSVGVVWVHPEITPREISIGTVEETDANGQVTRVSDRLVRFPFPSAVHFVALRSS